MGSISPAVLQIAGTVTANIAPQTGITPGAQFDVTSGNTTNIAANNARKRARVMNLSTNTNSIFIGSAAGSGAEVVSGVWVDIYDTAAIPIYNPGPATVTVGFEEYT